MFLLTGGHVDAASMAPLPRNTGGELYHYHPFSHKLDSAQLYNDLHWNLSRPQGMEAVMRVRDTSHIAHVGDLYTKYLYVRKR
jgi:protein transport protein SEC24